MQVYVIILMVLWLIGFGVNIGNNDGDKVCGSILEMIMLLPLFGRILGWW